MAAAPRYKVFDADGVYQAACKEVEAAAALMGLYGDGATIRDGHSAKHTVWFEGYDGEAGESYDAVVDVVRGRLGLSFNGAVSNRR